MIKRKRFLFWAAGCGVYASFMIGYLLVLTLLLPSMLVYEPEWVKVGSYAQYAVRQYSWERPVENGTYSWMIISTRTLASGETVATINETYTVEWKAEQWNSTWWWMDGIWRNIPSTGRISDINAKDGFMKFWFDRYYNDYLIGLTVFRKSNALPSLDTFMGLGLEEVSIHGVTRPSIKLMLRPSAWEASFYWFDRETGLLLQYVQNSSCSYCSQEPQSSAMILKNTNINSGANASNKATVDLLLVSPLFVVPSVGAATGLLLIKRRRRQFSLHFWLYFALLNGIFLSSVVNFPSWASLPILYLAFFSGGLFFDFFYGGLYFIFLIVSNALFWFLVLAAAVFLIDRFAFPLIQRRPRQLLPSPTRGEFRPPISTVPRAGEFKYCKHCGNRLPRDAKFCTSCGKEQ